MGRGRVSASPASPSRRRWLAAGLGLSACAGLGVWAAPRLFNPCLATLPQPLAGHPLVRKAWAGLDPAMVWDCHAHLAGIGDGGSGVRVSERMNSLFHPLEYVQRIFYLNAGCAHEAPGRVDQSFVERLHNLMEGMAPGSKLMLLAFDQAYDAQGRARPEWTAFHVPDAYARRIAQAEPQWFEWVCSIHPYRPDAVDALDAAVAAGARAVKWLPPAMGIDPADAACDRFYDALARHRLPLITHAGEEKAVNGANMHAWGNPLRLRRALDRGVRVVMAHCASIGEDVDLDRGEHGPHVPSFELFARMMARPEHRELLFGDISAVVLRNRSDAVMRAIVRNRDWHPRLFYGSDYPLPGILPLVSPAALARAGLLAGDAVAPLEAIRDHNPLLFNFVLTRSLESDGIRFPASVFETRRFFEGAAA